MPQIFSPSPEFTSFLVSLSDPDPLFSCMTNPFPPHDVPASVFGLVSVFSCTRVFRFGFDLLSLFLDSAVLLRLRA